MRHLKDLMVEVGSKPDIDLEASSVALAFIYLEKLIMKGFVTKANRKVVSAACLVLAAKTNDPKFVVGQDFYQPLYEVSFPLSLFLASFHFFDIFIFSLSSSFDCCHLLISGN